MAKQTRIPELVVGKISIDDGTGDNVYTLDVDNAEGTLRIGDNKNGSVATINQNTGRIEAASFAGDGSGLENLTLEDLEEIKGAKLLTLTANSLFFKFDAGGDPTPIRQEINLIPQVQNVDAPVYKWTSDDPTFVIPLGPGGSMAKIRERDFGDRSSLTITVEVEDLDLWDTVTLMRVSDGAQGESAIQVGLTNEVHNFAATSNGLVNPEDYATGGTDIIAYYGTQRLRAGKPSSKNDAFSPFFIVAAFSEGADATYPDDGYVVFPDKDHITPSNVPGDEKYIVAGPTNLRAAVGTVVFSIKAYVEEGADPIIVQKIQSLSKTSAGATGEDSLVVKLTADDYQFAYDSEGSNPKGGDDSRDPAYIVFTATPQNHGGLEQYRWFVDGEPWAPGDSDSGGRALDAGQQHEFTDSDKIRLYAEPSHSDFGGSKIVKVETTKTDGSCTNDICATDEQPVIATKDGSNAIQVVMSNAAHVYSADSDGLVDDPASGENEIWVYHGNDLLKPNSDVQEESDNFGGTVGGDIDTIEEAIDTLGPKEYFVVCNASDFITSEGRSRNTISVNNPTTNNNSITYVPGAMHAETNQAAIVYTIYLKDHSGAAASIIQTQTLARSKQGSPGTPGAHGTDGAGAKVVKLTSNDYQFAYDENGGNPKTGFGGNGTISLKAKTQGHQQNNLLCRFMYNGAPLAPSLENRSDVNSPWFPEGWFIANATTVDDGVIHRYHSLSVDWGDVSYDEFGKKRTIEVQTLEVGLTTDRLAIDETDENGDVLTWDDVKDRAHSAVDSISIIATKEGSNALEVVADNLSHAFVADNDGTVTDFTGGGIKFEAYIGNTPLKKWNEADGLTAFLEATGVTDTFFVTSGGTSDGISIANRVPWQFGDTVSAWETLQSFSKYYNTGYIDWKIHARDSTGELRPTRTLTQTFTKSKAGSNAPLVRLTSTSNIFSFEDAYDWTASPETITFYPTAQNLDGEIKEGDITFWKNDVDVSDKIKNYDQDGTAYMVKTRMKNSLAADGSFTLKLGDFMPIATDDFGNPIPPNLWTSPGGEENITDSIHHLKRNGFPIIIKFEKGGLSDSVPLVALDGGSDTINVIAPNNIHIFTADAEGYVSSELYADSENSPDSHDSGTDIQIYQGSRKLLHEDDPSAPADKKGTYRFGSISYGVKVGSPSENAEENLSNGQMVEVQLRSDNSGINVVGVSSGYTNQTIKIPVTITAKTGEQITEGHDIQLFYSKTKAGKDGTDLKDRNFDFSQGDTGWSLEGDLGTGADMISTQMYTESDPDAVHGGAVGVFEHLSLVNSDRFFELSDSTCTRPIFISKALPIGGTGETYTDTTGEIDVERPMDEGKWKINFRARPKNGYTGGSVNHGTLTETRAWVFIRAFKGTEEDDYKDMVFWWDEDLYDSLFVIGDGSGGTKFGGQLMDGKAEVWSVPLMGGAGKGLYMNWGAEFTPHDVLQYFPGAHSFKIGFAFCNHQGNMKLDVDLFQAERIPYASLIHIDREAFELIRENERAAVTNAINNSDLSSRFGHMVGGSAKTISQDLFNGELKVTDSHGLPEGIIITRWDDDVTRDSDSVLYMGEGNLVLPSKLQTKTLFSEATDQNKRNGIVFRAIKVPSQDHKLHVSIKYHTTENSSNEKPSVYLYAADEDLSFDQKYIGSKTSEWRFSENSSGESGSDIVYERAGSNMYKDLLSLDDNTGNNAVASASISCDISDDEWEGTNDLGNPKYISIVIYSGNSDNNSQLWIHEVTAEWEDTIASAARAKAEAEAAAAGVELVKNTQADMTLQSSAVVNGRFDVLDSFGQPANVAFVNYKSNGTHTFVDRDQVNIWGFEETEDDGRYFRLQGYNDSYTRQRAIIFPVIAVPEGHYIEVNFKFKGGFTKDGLSNNSYGPRVMAWATSEAIDETSTTHLGWANIGTADDALWKADNTFKNSIRTSDVKTNSASPYRFEPSEDWKEETVRIRLDDTDANPKFCSISIHGASQYSAHTTTLHGDLYLKFVNVTFKKNVYLSGDSFPTDLISQTGDQFFFESGVEDFGYLTTYGKKKLSFAVASETSYGFFENFGRQAYAYWPELLDAQWKKTTGTWQNVIKLQYDTLAGIDTSWKSSYIFARHYAKDNNTYSQSVLTHRRPFFGKGMVRVPDVQIWAVYPGYSISQVESSYGDIYSGGTAMTYLDNHPAANIRTYVSCLPDGGSRTTIKSWDRENYNSDDSDAWHPVTATGQWQLQIVARSLGHGFNSPYYDEDTGKVSNLLCVGLGAIEVISFTPTTDEKNEARLFELAALTAKTITTFTGQHKCAFIGEEEGLKTGLIVSSVGKYDNLNYDHQGADEGEVSTKRHSVNPQEAVPVVALTFEERDKKVLGVVCEKWNGKSKNNLFLTDGERSSTTDRYEINSLGEGGIWVSNFAGDLENGDYICSSNIPGYGMKQDDDILRNYTVAKITQDCAFDLDSEIYDCKEVEHDGIMYKVAFVGCTYHCG